MTWSRWRAGRGTVVGTALVLAGAFLVPGPARPVDAAPSGASWPAYLADAGHSGHNRGATAITPGNAGHLRLAWRFSPDRATEPGQPAGFYASPVTSAGRVYVGARTGWFYALDEATGRVLWKRFFGYRKGLTCGPEGFTATATVAPDPGTKQSTVYLSPPDGKLYAVSAATGATVWSATVDTPSPTVNDYYAWSSPTVQGGTVYVGVSAQCDNPLVRGGLRAFDQRSGRPLGTFDAVPEGARGASIWSSAAVSSTGVYATTGNAASTYGQSILRLSPRTLAGVQSWAVPAAERVPDSDFGGSPTLFTGRVAGVATPLVAACNKNGVLYALRAGAVAAGPVWQLRLGDPYRGGVGQCDAAPVFDGSRLYAASNSTTIGGTRADGSVRRLDPGTGAVLWATPVGGPVIVSPTLNGSGLLAAVTFNVGAPNAAYLLRADTGRQVARIALPTASFSQPVFSDGLLLLTGTGAALSAYRP